VEEEQLDHREEWKGGERSSGDNNSDIKIYPHIHTRAEDERKKQKEGKRKDRQHETRNRFKIGLIIIGAYIISSLSLYFLFNPVLFCLFVCSSKQNTLSESIKTT
jgi:hypothetical protein